MGNWGRCDFSQLKNLQKQLEQLEQQNNKFCEDCARYLAQRLLAKVIKRTPEGNYEARQVEFDTRSGKHVSFTAQASGIKGGTLRRGWTTQESGSGSEGIKAGGASQYAQTLRVNHFGDTYVVEITNPTEYASYVEYGHRTANHKDWVPGQFMLTISERELQNQASAMLERKIAAYIKGVL